MVATSTMLVLSEPSMRKLILLAACAATFALGACNTIEGLGRDAQAAGQAVSGAARDAR